MSAKDISAIHDAVINPGDMQGLAGHKSLESACARIENRIAYEGVSDIFELAAFYVVVIARGHVFNDANKRTAFQTMETFLHINGIYTTFDIDIGLDTEEIGDLIISVAQGNIDEEALAEWLRAHI